MNETVKQALMEAIDRRRKDPAFRASLCRIVKEDRKLLEHQGQVTVRYVDLADFIAST